LPDDEAIMIPATALDRARRRVLMVLAGAAVILATGCGDGRVRVSGTVRFEGAPVEEGIISFEPVDGKGPTTGGSITDGRYDLTGDARATEGEKIVRIVGSRKTGRKVPAGGPAPAGTMIEERVQCIPRQYNDQSTLKVRITPGRDNTHNFDLPTSAKP
jgi:hypothetical protein